MLNIRKSITLGEVLRAFFISLAINGFSQEVLPLCLHSLEESWQCLSHS